MKIAISNFQSIKQAELVLDRFTAIVGPSDRGKSAALRAIEAAFFNLPGEYFVRTGAPHATVQIGWSGIGLDSAVHTVEWRKGSGKNEFTVDGVSFARVGQKAPDVLKTLGFRAELIGARLDEDGKPDGGKWVRPQFAGQFDEIFLLTEQGTFISEVVVKLSRLGVLQRAERQCALDLRQAKVLLKIKQGDLSAATQVAERLAQAPLLRARLDALIELNDDLDAKKAAAAKIRDLVQRRQRVLGRQLLALPTPVPRAQITEAQEDYLALLQARELIRRRSLLVSLPKKLPKSYGTASPQYKALSLAVKRYTQLGQLVGAREMRQAATDAAASRVRQAEAAVQQTREKLGLFKQQSPICPLCERVWAEDSDHALATV